MLTFRVSSLRIVAVVLGGFVAGCIGDSAFPGQNQPDASTPDTGSTVDSGADSSVGKDASDDATVDATVDADGSVADVGSDAPPPLNAFPTHATSAAIVPNAGDLTGATVINTDAPNIEINGVVGRGSPNTSPNTTGTGDVPASAAGRC